MFKNIRSLTKASLGSLENIYSMIDALEPFEKASREMRPVARRLKQGLTILVDSISISKYWVELIENTGIDCED